VERAFLDPVSKNVNTARPRKTQTRQRHALRVGEPWGRPGTGRKGHTKRLLNGMKERGKNAPSPKGCVSLIGVWDRVSRIGRQRTGPPHLEPGQADRSQDESNRHVVAGWRKRGGGRGGASGRRGNRRVPPTLKARPNATS